MPTEVPRALLQTTGPSRLIGKSFSILNLERPSPKAQSQPQYASSADNHGDSSCASLFSQMPSSNSQSFRTNKHRNTRRALNTTANSPSWETCCTLSPQTFGVRLHSDDQHLCSGFPIPKPPPLSVLDPQSAHNQLSLLYLSRYSSSRRPDASCCAPDRPDLNMSPTKHLSWLAASLKPKLRSVRCPSPNLPK